MVKTMGDSRLPNGDGGVKQSLTERIELAENAVIDWEIVLQDCGADLRRDIEKMREARLRHADACRHLESLLAQVAEDFSCATIR
jgi:hypothetical protein